MSEFAKSLRAGDFFDEVGSSYYLQYFAKEIRPDGVWVDRAYRPRESVRTRTGTTHTTYSILAHHGSLIPFDSKWWNQKLIKTGYIPSLCTALSVTIPPYESLPPL